MEKEALLMKTVNKKLSVGILGGVLALIGLSWAPTSSAGTKDQEQMETVETLTRDQQAQIVNELYAIIEAKQRGAIIIDPSILCTRKLTA
jgi:hypothetical protein